MNSVKHVSSFVALTACALLALGSSSPATSSSSEPAAGDGGKGATTTSSTITSPGRSADKPWIMATCLKKAAGTCDEFYGLVPKFTPDDCVKEGGLFHRDTDSQPADPECPKSGLLGTCHYKASEGRDQPGQFVNVYSASALKQAKADCLEEIPGGTVRVWTEPPAAPAPKAESAKAKPKSAPAAKSKSPPPKK
jgi:hypothetical protein